jgi:branched-chain amino acid transport system substrate-binding protein
MKMPFALRLISASLMSGLVTTAIAAEPVKIAFIDVLSGPFALSGQVSLRQFREAVNDVNATNLPGDPKFEVVAIDGKGTPPASLVALTNAEDQGIHYITQGGGSGVAFALSDAITKLAERDPSKSIVYLNYDAMDPGLTNEKCTFWHFRFYPSSAMQIEALTTYMKDRKDIKKIFLLNQNYTHGQQVSKLSKEYLAAKRPDIQIVGDEFIPIATTLDFAPYVSQIASSGADTVITSNWGSDLSLLFKAAHAANLNVNFFTLNGNNPGSPTALGPYGVGKVGVIWGSGANAPTPVLEKIAVSYKKKANEDFIYAAHWNTVHMLREAIRAAHSTDPKKVAYALEGMHYDSPVGDVEMRKSDHQLQAPLYLGIWDKQNGTTVKYDAEGTGYGFRSEKVWDSYVAAQPTSCQMKRPD